MIINNINNLYSNMQYIQLIIIVNSSVTFLGLPLIIRVIIIIYNFTLKIKLFALWW